MDNMFSYKIDTILFLFINHFIFCFLLMEIQFERVTMILFNHLTQLYNWHKERMK